METEFIFYLPLNFSVATQQKIANLFSEIRATNYKGINASFIIMVSVAKQQTFKGNKLIKTLRPLYTSPCAIIISTFKILVNLSISSYMKGSCLHFMDSCGKLNQDIRSCCFTGNAERSHPVRH